MNRDRSTSTTDYSLPKSLARSSVDRHQMSLLHRLVNQPLFWTSVVSMFVAFISMVAIIVLCCQRGNRSGRSCLVRLWSRDRSHVHQSASVSMARDLGDKDGDDHDDGSQWGDILMQSLPSVSVSVCCVVAAPVFLSKEATGGGRNF